MMSLDIGLDSCRIVDFDNLQETDSVIGSGLTAHST